MCRFVLYLGCEITVSSLVTEPENSIINQSFKSREREEPLNGDGFGLAWYVPEVTEEPALFKDITPAWNNINLLNLARVTSSTCVLAHVRAATSNFPVIQLNCHPFASGPFSFMHNGKVAGFNEIKRSLMARLSDEAYATINGSTDSEYLFALFLDYFYDMDDSLERVERMARALSATIREVDHITEKAGIKEANYMNLAVTDGTSAVATRHVSPSADEGEEDANTLYVHTGGGFECKAGHLKETATEKGHAVVIASEPLTEDKGWQRVTPNTMVLVTKGLEVETRDL
jgi:predicted glutamine amidotransferase